MCKSFDFSQQNCVLHGCRYNDNTGGCTKSGDIKDNKLKPGIIALIISGSIVGLVIIILIFYFVFKQKILEMPFYSDDTRTTNSSADMTFSYTDTSELSEDVRTSELRDNIEVLDDMKEL